MPIVPIKRGFMVKERELNIQLLFEEERTRQIKERERERRKEDMISAKEIK